MNQLDNVSLSYANLSSPMIDNCAYLTMRTNGYINLPANAVLRLDGQEITAADLYHKLQLLDRLIAQYLPEEYI